VGGGRSDYPGTVLVYIPWRWIAESRVVRGAHLFTLPIDVQSGLEPQWWRWGEMAPTFVRVVWPGEAFQGLGVQDIAEFDSG
jgi:hypothetical protein